MKNEELALPLNGFLPETISTEHSLVTVGIRGSLYPTTCMILRLHEDHSVRNMNDIHAV